MSFASKRKNLVALSFCIAAAAAALPHADAGIIYWDADANATAATGGTGTWDTSSSLWRSGSSVGSLTTWTNAGGDNDAYLTGTAGTLTASVAISVNDIVVAPSSGTAYVIAGAPNKLTFVSTPTIDVASGSSLTITTGLAGTGFSKTSAGTLLLDAPQGGSNIVGAIAVTGGTLQVGTANATAGYNIASQVLRSNAVSVSSGAILASGNVSGTGAFSEIRTGTVSGSGTIAVGTATTPANAGLVITALADGTYSGNITGTGGLQVRGGNGTTQTLSGDLTALTGTYSVNSGATVVFSGTGDSVSGVTGATSLAPRGGTLTFDSSGGNTGAATGRVSDSATVVMGGGTLSLIGNSAGTTENVGTLTLNNGNNVISVTNNGTGAQLTFNDSGSLRDGTGMVVNFVGAGTGTLGTAGNNPRITFSGALFTNTTNGMLANTSGATVQTIGWATVNGTSWAGVGANGIVALADAASRTTAATLQTAASWELVNFAPAATPTTLTGNVGTSATVSIGALKISPTASGQTLDVNTRSVFSPALMLVGSNDFTITGTTGGFGAGTATRYVYVTQAGVTLNYSATFLSTGAVNKAGPGILNLNAGASQMIAARYNILDGVLRGTTTSLGGSASSGGANSSIDLRGGVLEISGGGSFSRFLGAGAAGGGGIRWTVGSTDRGDGGFSAISANASVTLVTAAGGGTAATPVWDATSGFISSGYALVMGSTKADSTIDFTNSIGLDDNAATNPYNAREVRVIDNTSSSTDIARLSGVISGSSNSDLLKTGGGVLELSNNNNTYAGNTLIKDGKLKLTTSSATNIASSANIVVGLASGSSAVLDVTGVTNATGFEVQSGQTLGGHGKILSTAVQTKINSGATIAPGTSIGTLSIDGGSFTLAGNAAFEITGNAAANTYDKITGVNSAIITYGGSLTVSFLNTTPTAAGIYTLFSGFSSPSGTFSNIYLPTAPAGLQWHNYGGSLFNYATGQIQLETASTTVTVTPSSGDLPAQNNAVTISITGGSATLGSFATSGLGWSTNGLTAGSFSTTQNLNTVASSSGRLNGLMRGRTSFAVSGATTGNGTYSYTLSNTVSGQSVSPGAGTTFGTAQSSTLLSGDKFTGQNSVEAPGGFGHVATLVDSTTLGGDSDIALKWRNRSAFEAYPGTTPPLPTNISSLITDVVNVDLGANAPSAYVIQMSYDPAGLGGLSETDSFVAGHLYLAHMTPEFFSATDTGNGGLEDRWQNATLDSGNPQTNGFLRGYQTSDLATIGSWGVDTDNHVAWAVVPASEQGQFAIVPEPASLGLLALGALGLLRRKR